VDRLAPFPLTPAEQGDVRDQAEAELVEIVVHQRFAAAAGSNRAAGEALATAAVIVGWNRWESDVHRSILSRGERCG
jgi:hypothetical protein